MTETWRSTSIISLNTSTRYDVLFIVCCLLEYFLAHPHTPTTKAPKPSVPEPDPVPVVVPPPVVVQPIAATPAPAAVPPPPIPMPAFVPVPIQDELPDIEMASIKGK